MSDSLQHPQDKNTPPETDPKTSRDPAGQPPSVNDQPNHLFEMPLPDFNPGADKEISDPVTKESPATSPDLADFLATQRQPNEPEAGQQQPQPVYNISSAEPDWSNYTLPPLEEPPPEPETGSNWKTAWAVLREVGETILLTLIIFLLIQTIIRNFRVVGTSMVNNLHDGQYLIIDKLSYNPFVVDTLGFSGPQRGDVVVFEPPNRPTEDYVKRIIALPGETVEIKQGQVLINGQPLDQPYQPGTASYTMPPRTVPEGHVFVLGDNRNNSNDSHNWGPLPIENIVGRAWLSYWPPDRWGTIPRDVPTEVTTLKHFLNELVPSANAESE